MRVHVYKYSIVSCQDQIELPWSLGIRKDEISLNYDLCFRKCSLEQILISEKSQSS